MSDVQSDPFVYGDSAITVEHVESSKSDDIVVLAARTSTNRGLINPKSDKKLIEFLMRHQHTSPFEMADATYLIDCPIFIARQVQRHRTASYNELSRRYTDENVQIWIPASLRVQSSSGNIQGSNGVVDANDLFIKAIKNEACRNLALYTSLIEKGVAREQARVVLPQSTMTRFYMKMNLHNWLKFLSLRLASDAQHEIRVLADKIFADLLRRFPRSVEAWETTVRSQVSLSGDEISYVKRLIEEDSGPVEISAGARIRLLASMSE